MSTAAVAVENLSFRYADSERWVLRDVRLSARAGETLLILGPSGCGKSTLALCLNGLIPHLIEGEMTGSVLVWGAPPMWSTTSPDVEIAPPVREESSRTTATTDSSHSTTAAGDDARGGSRRLETSYSTATMDSSHSTVHTAFVGEVFQDPETQMVMPHVDEEVAFGLEGLGIPPAEMPALISAALKLVGLDDRPRAWVDALSGGQKQRLALAAVLALRPGVLVLDEPTANLDPQATASFYATLARLKADLGITVVLIEHQLDAVLPLVDRIVAMNRQGQVIGQGTPHEVFATYGDELEREGVWLPMTCRLMTALRERGWPVAGCPLTMDEVEASLRDMWSTTLRMWSTTSPDVAIAPSRQEELARATAATTDSSHSTTAAGDDIARGSTRRLETSYSTSATTAAGDDIARGSTRRLETSCSTSATATSGDGAMGITRRRESSYSTSAAAESSHATAAIDMRDVTFAYPDSPPALRNVSLQIARGRFFAIVGANGSGKTTLAKHLVGLLRPSSGALSVLGQETRRRSPAEMAQQVGYVFQNPEHQFVTERVADELAYSLRGRWPQEEIERRVKELLTTFGLQGYEDENPFALSQGQKRRLSVATMVALDQPILILDEPTFGQDQQSTTALMATIQQLHDAGTTVIFITHDMQLVATYADEVAVMNEGQIIFQGAPRTIFAQPDILQRASLMLPPLAALARRLGLAPLLTVAEWVAWPEAGRQEGVA